MPILAARDPRFDALWIWASATIGMILIILAVSAAYPERFKPGAPTWTWYVLWIGGALTVAAALVVSYRSERQQSLVAVAG